MSSLPIVARPTAFQYPALPNMEWNWYGQRVRTFCDRIEQLAEMIPTFDRIPFVVGELFNPRADLVLRQPIEKDDRKIPVAMVSKYYELISHHEVLGWLEEALAGQDMDWKATPAILMMSEFGERIYLRFIVPGYQFHPGDGHLIHLQAHVLNSVDKSVALQFRLGWYRAICGNGLYWGKEVGHIRRVHTTIQTPMNLPEIFKEEIAKVEKEKARLLNWFDQPVPLPKIEEWVDTVLTPKLGVQAAAYICHVARTGHTALVEQTNKKIAAHAYPCRSLTPVPGMTGSARTIFDVLQILSFVARERSNIQNQIELLNMIPDLVKPLLEIKN